MARNFFKEGYLNFKDVFMRLKKRDFSGNTGQAIKNSTYQLLTTVFAKGGSLIFTIILARFLLPELFGLYTLTMSTILFFGTIAGLGIGETLTRYLSKTLSKSKNLFVKAYTNYFGKILLISTLFFVLILVSSSKFISENYYQKPIFFPLLIGCFYIVFYQLSIFFQSILRAFYSFREIFYREIIFQTLRILLVLFAIIIIFNKDLSLQSAVSLVFVAISLAYFLISIFLWIITHYKLKGMPATVLKSPDKKQARKFFFPMSLTVFSGIFFNYIDIIMLGYFVGANFVGFYGAAFSFIGALAPLLSFGAISLLPIFSRLENKQLQRGLKKAISFTSFTSFTVFLLVLLFSPIIVSIVYGNSYAPAATILRLFAPLVIITALSTIYQTYFISKGNPQKIAKLLVISSIFNVILNYTFISFLLHYGPLMGVYGAVLATLASRLFYLIGLVFLKR